MNNEGSIQDKFRGFVAPEELKSRREAGQIFI